MAGSGHIGIFGGMFDPVHVGHLRAAITTRETLGLDELRLLPCARPAHRGSPMADDRHRLAMLELAIRGEPGLGIDEREIRRAGTSYLVDTLSSLREDHPDSGLYFLLGSDAFSYLDHWHRWEELLPLSHWVVMPRPGWELSLSERLRAVFEERRVSDRACLRQECGGRIWVSEPGVLELSSTTIREIISRGTSLRYLLPDTVIEYIQNNHLYRHED